jgi:murein DD-endopeptidase MepM/ murein hydrolase activator NlpD
MMKRMSKNILWAVGLSLFLVSLFPCVHLRAGVQDEPNVSIQLSSRALKPGEIVKILILSDRSADRVRLSYLNRGFPAADRGEGKQFLAFIGLDMDIKPGIYPLIVTLLFENGYQHQIKKEIVVESVEFAVKKLWVNEKFVTPPPEVHERIKRESELIQTVYEMFTVRWRGDGDFILPAEGEITPNFGERRIFNNQPRSAHSGVDISSPFGDPVKASNSGKVVVANDLYYAGKTVILDHGLGVFSLYCHFSEIAVELGDEVSKGGVIGKIGATGRVTGPHLHWGIRVLESRIDPLSLLALDCKQK